MNLHRLLQAPYWSCLRSARLLWLALLIALFTALGPTLSLMMSSDASSVPSLLDICSSDPSHRVDGAQPQWPDQDTPTGFLKHCPLCLHITGHVALPSGATVLWGEALGTPVVPAMAPAFALINLLARMALPRGPPALRLLSK
jgi:hypothetical protein